MPSSRPAAPPPFCFCSQAGFTRVSEPPVFGAWRRFAWRLSQSSGCCSGRSRRPRARAKRAEFADTRAAAVSAAYLAGLMRTRLSSREHGRQGKRAMFCALPSAPFEPTVEACLSSVVRCACQASDDPAQLGLPDRFGRFFGGEPPDLAFTVLGPPLALSRYLERVHPHFTDDATAVLKTLAICK